MYTAYRRGARKLIWRNRAPYTLCIGIEPDWVIDVEKIVDNHGKKSMDVIRILAALILPPLGVFLQVGLRGHFWLNLILTFFGFVPGIIHAVWVIVRYPRRDRLSGWQ